MNPDSAAAASGARIETVIETLKKVISEELSLSVDINDLDENVALVEEGLALDSIVIVQLIGIIEERLGFEFQDTDLRMRSFATIRSLAEVVLRRIEQNVK